MCCFLFGVIGIVIDGRLGNRLDRLFSKVADDLNALTILETQLVKSMLFYVMSDFLTVADCLTGVIGIRYGVT